MKRPQYVLDTDHATLYLNHDPGVSARIAAFPPGQVVTTIVTAQELVAGWLPQLTKQQPSSRYVTAYAGLRRALDFLSEIDLLDFDNAAASQYTHRRATYRRLGANDLRIAATVLSVGAILVTRNKQHFQQVNGLLIEDWSK